MNHALIREKRLVTIAVLTLAISAVAVSLRAKAQDFPERLNYVHDYVEPQGNWTYMEKPMFPIRFNESQIGIGQNWSIVCPLRENHSYHVYCYGEWVNNGSEPKTDYDIYVYNPLGELEGYHTESAGLPEHLGTTVNEPFFIPSFSGNYTFVINNDQKESNGTQRTTFMIVENVNCNAWQEHYVEGKGDYDLPVLNTSWAYEFATESQHVEVWVKVPESLDMYEARLYLMADPTSKNHTVLNDVPLAWEPGLYDERNDTLGGYNLESKEYRGVAYASCEHYGQEMYLNWTSPHSGKSLYHLVLIGEAGNGTAEFLVKTEFGNVALLPSVLPVRVYPQNETEVAFTSNSTDLVNASLRYSTDNWNNVTVAEMEIVENRTCRAITPAQNAGVSVVYRVEAEDMLKNVLFVNGSYTVKYPTTLNLTLVHEIVHTGENITVYGHLSPELEGLAVTVVFDSSNDTKEFECYTLEDGTFTASFQTEDVGTWEIHAKFDGGYALYPVLSAFLSAKVEEPTFLMKYSLYIGGGALATSVAATVVYFKKFRQ